MILESFTPGITVPEGFVLVIDTREQTPLSFPPHVPVVYKALKQGDYSVVGFESKVGIERKNISDLLSSLGKGRKRFKAELERMDDYEWKGLLIEGTESSIYTPSRFSSLHHNSIYASLCAIELMGFHIYYAPDQAHAWWWVLSRLVRYYKIKREK